MTDIKKILLFIPKEYPLGTILEEGFLAHGIETILFDVGHFYHQIIFNLFIRSSDLPKKMALNFPGWFIKKVNKKYLKLVDQIKPEVIIVYNDQYILPETIREIRKKNCIVINFLGDNPIYVSKRNSNIEAMLEMSYVLAPDTYWVKQIQEMGIKNISFFLPGFTKKINFKENPPVTDYLKYKSDLIMVGNLQPSNWGYKRAYFYNLFADLDIKIYGQNWDRWLNSFPRLKNKVIKPASRISAKLMNTMLNCSKIYPIEHNPTIINGIHSRVFESIASGILPLVEYRKDLDLVFTDCEIPTIKSYENASSIAAELLDNEEKRTKTLAELRKFIDSAYTSKITAAKLLNIINEI
jgi:hypothetical protein